MIDNPTILIIEDSATVRNFLCRLFEREWPEARLVEAEDGSSALHEMGRCKADLIVTDLQMPGMDGRSFIAKIRSNALLKKKKVIVLSGDDTKDLKDLYASDAGIAFLAKPSGSEIILQTVRRLLAAQTAMELS